MEILINELSVHEQFSTIDDFSNALKNTIKMYKTIPTEFTVLKKSDVWSYKPVPDLSLYSILKIRGRSEITRFKSVLSNMITSEPYWDLEPRHSSPDEYNCENIDNLSGYSIAEACERDCIVISFFSERFGTDEIIVCKNKINNITVSNLQSKNDFLEYLIGSNFYWFKYYCSHRFEESRVDFVVTNGVCQIEQFFCSLMDDEKALVVAAIKKMVLDYVDKDIPLPENLSKNIDSNIFELRVYFPNRICRLFYFYSEEKSIVFTHGFIKKTQKTPRCEISRAKTQRDNYSIRDIKN